MLVILWGDQCMQRDWRNITPKRMYNCNSLWTLLGGLEQILSTTTLSPGSSITAEVNYC